MTLADALSADPRVSAHIDCATIDRLTLPKNYLGGAPEMVDRPLAASKRWLTPQGIRLCFRQIVTKSCHPSG